MVRVKSRSPKGAWPHTGSILITRTKPNSNEEQEMQGILEMKVSTPALLVKQ